MYEQRFNPFAANISIVKGYLKSGKVLLLGILYLLSLVLSVINLLIPKNLSSVYDYLDLLNNMGVDTSELITYYSGADTSVLILTTVISAVITLLTAVGFIVMFAKSRSQNPESSPAAGVGILHVLSVITFVVSIIAAVLCGLAYLLIVIAGGSISDYYSFDGDMTAAVLIIVGVALAIVLFFLIFVTAAQKNFYRSIKHSLSTVQLHNKGAAAYGVLNIIFAVCSGVTAIGSLITLINYFNLSTLLSFLSAVLNLFILILTASFALGYNSYIKRQKLGYSNTPYGGAPNNAYVPADNGANPYAAPRSNGYGDNYRSYNAPPQGAPVYRDDHNAPTGDFASYCPNCGSPADPNAPYCPNCGAKLS